jgi:hypothetical protein
MEKDPLLLKDQADGMDAAPVDKMEALKKKDGVGFSSYKI